MGQPDKRVGSIGWFDLTVDDADRVRDFYADVVGWKMSSVPMGSYADYGVHRPDGDEMIAGICHARGPNANLPPVWLPYVNVADLDRSLNRTETLGGRVIVGERSMGGMGRMAVVSDPSGAMLALFEHPAPVDSEHDSDDDSDDEGLGEA
ncbi:MAG TPA: glyoxalase [Planctomycetaceae bacterium]|nr:glyoxalase [Planctomycetaceae bacterium]